MADDGVEASLQGPDMRTLQAEDLSSDELQGFSKSAEVRTEVLLKFLLTACPSSSIRAKICTQLEADGIMDDSWQQTQALKKGISEDLSVPSDLEEEIPPVDDPVEAVDLLQMEVFNSGAIKNVGRFNCEFLRYDCLGRGGFGRAFRVHHLVDEQEYCIKELHLNASKFHGSVSRMVAFARGVLREVSALSRCEHENVVKYNNAWAELVTERLEPQTQLDEDMSELDLNDSGRPSQLESSQPLTSSHHQSPKETQAPASSEGNSGNREDSDGYWDRSFTATGEPSSLGADEATAAASCKTSALLGDHSAEELMNTEARAPDKFFKVTMARVLQVLLKAIQDDDVAMERSVLHTVSEIEAEMFKRDVVLYIQMELCQNRTLGHFLAEEQREIKVDQYLQILVAILRGLKHVHDLGICHRDLKPANLFISKDGVIKLGDFGLAKSTTQLQPPSPNLSEQSDAAQLKSWYQRAFDPSAVHQAQHTRGVGTPIYSAPEQIAGGDCDATADIFSFGIIAVELFNIFGSGMERIMVLSRAREGTLPNDMQTQHKQLSDLVVECLQKEPKLRPTAEQVLNRLSPMIHGAVLPPLLELADRTIFEMQQQLDAKDQSLKAQAALIAELRKEVTEKDQIITKQKSDLETLKEKVERMTSGSASPST